MTSLSIHAHAKTNLSLRIHGRRQDGFHEVATRMCLLSLADVLRLDLLSPGSGLHFTMEGADWNPTSSEENLVQTACRVFRETTNRQVDVAIHLTKRIPSGAGLGGGSSDAAATLIGLDRLLETQIGSVGLVPMAAKVGSDVPFFLLGGSGECTGRGECVTPLDDDWELPVVLIKPAFPVPTPDAYRRWSQSREIPGVPYTTQVCPWGEMVNDLERPVFEKYPLLADMKCWLLDQPEVHAALLSGSGSTILAILSNQHGGEGLAARAVERYGGGLWTYVGQTLASPAGLAGAVREPVPQAR